MAGAVGRLVAWWEARLDNLGVVGVEGAPKSKGESKEIKATFGSAESLLNNVIK